MREQPDNVQIRAAYLRSKEGHLRKLLTLADDSLQAERFDEAATNYQSVLRLHPENNRALAGLVQIETKRRNRALLTGAQASLDKGELELARQQLRMVLAQEPGRQEAVALLRQVDAKAGKKQGVATPELDPKFRRTITLEFRGAPLRSVFDAVSRQSGLNFVFDKDVQADARATVYARDTELLDAVDMLLATSQLDRKIVSPNTMLIYPNQPAKQREYQDLVVKSFFLANADAKTTLNMVKTMTRTRDVFVDEKLNLMVVRDTPEAVRLIEKLVAVQDRPEPEVMLEVEILEVKRSRLLELGVQWPTSLSVLGKTKNTTPVFDQFGTKVGETISYNDVPLTLDLLKNIEAGTVAMNVAPAINANKNDGDVNILANPRIRVKNKEKANIHVGDKVPVITATVTSTGVTSESVSYLDVGLKLDVEPQVHLDGDVGIKVGLEVSNIVQQIKTNTGSLTYQLGSRNASTSLRLRDGETQVLAGLISDEDRSSASKIPGLGDIPILGHLFSSHRDDKSKSEIVLLITPHVVRKLERPELQNSEFFAGTEAVISDHPLRIRPAAAVDANGDRGGWGARPDRPPVVPPGMLVTPAPASAAQGNEGAASDAPPATDAPQNP